MHLLLILILLAVLWPSFTRGLLRGMGCLFVIVIVLVVLAAGAHAGAA